VKVGQRDDSDGPPTAPEPPGAHARTASDAFSALGLSRRPWVDVEEVQARFRERAAQLHPDANPGSDGAAFAALNEAAAVLSDPVRRLRHLLVLEGIDAAGSTIVPAELQDLGFAVGAALGAAEEARHASDAAGSALARAVVLPRVLEARGACEDLLERIRAELETLDRWLRVEDAGARLPELAAAADRLVYLRRWESQVRVALLGLAF
jgi:curved DNA-binding protein CbpA